MLLRPLAILFAAALAMPASRAADPGSDSGPASEASESGGPPEASDPGITVEKFAGSDLIVHPTGLTFTRSGELLAVESHTHFRPDDYEGPEGDRIVRLRDTDGDGAADERNVFFEGDLAATMDLATDPESGAIYVATRDEILRLRDEDGDGVADPGRVERRLVYLDTEGDYPHNGVSGLAFDDEGGLYFGVGENLGAAYTLRGSDGSSVSDQGEGGNVWRVTRDGGELRRFATGFWNPFGVCWAPGGHVFATDNDPSSRPPCRLHSIIEGGDYGYQYRYGRRGHHPFISWDGELTGALPMLHGSGEAPCDVIFHRGHLLVASWADHRLERYPLTWEETHFTTERDILVQGGVEFRPVALAFGPDGALYCSDWVKSDYQLHGHGAVWRIEGWDPEPRSLPDADATALQRGDRPFLEAVEEADPWTLSRRIEAESRLGESGGPSVAWGDCETARQKIACLLVQRRRHGNADPNGIVPRALADPDPEVRLLALKWIADERLESYRDAATSLAESPPTPTLSHAAVTAVARLDGEDVDDRALQQRIGRRLRKGDVSPEVKRAAFRVLADRDEYLKISDLRELYEGAGTDFRIEVMLTLLTHSDREGAVAFAGEVVASEEASPRVKRFAREVLGEPGDAEPPADAESRPPFSDTDAWLARLDAVDRSGAPERRVLDHGRLVFFRHCAVCHRADDFGKQGGPDLTAIHERGRRYILESILRPNAEVAPQYEAWELTLADGGKRIGFMLGQRGGRHFYADVAGNEFEINNRTIVERKRIPVSLMPPGLPLQMTDGEFADLLTWLARPRG